ncbi:MAG TPA: hypothetical protein VF463_03925 [Sphingobium sp.]
MRTDVLAEADSLQEATSKVLDRDPSTEAIEYERRWYNWGELRHVADRSRPPCGPAAGWSKPLG